MRIRLKRDCVWQRDGEVLVVLCNPSVWVELDDPHGQTETLLKVLATRPHTFTELHAELNRTGLAVTDDELRAAVEAFDDLRFLENADDQSLGSPDADERHFSNVAFFDLYSTLGTSAVEYQRRIRQAHVVQLGTGGLGSNTIQNLAGLGVGRLTLLDCDAVEPRNFARQFLYHDSDIGSSKVTRAAEWVRAFAPDIDVTAVERRVTSPSDLADLLDDADLVVSGIDRPLGIDDWVNEACLTARTPWIRGGMWGSQLRYYSVNPGHSPCLACARATGSRERAELFGRVPGVNRAAGPVATLLGALVAFEAVRYLTGYEQPYAAGADVILDIAAGSQQERISWRIDPDCGLCRHARTALVAS